MKSHVNLGKNTDRGWRLSAQNDADFWARQPMADLSLGDGCRRGASVATMISSTDSGGMFVSCYLSGAVLRFLGDNEISETSKWRRPSSCSSA